MKNKLLLWTFCAALVTGCGSGKSLRMGGGGPNYQQAYQDYVALGAQYLQKGRYDLAEPKLKRAIEIDSQPAEAWNILAVLYEEKRDIASGYQVYQKLTDSHPNYALGYTNFATFLCKFNRESERQALYQKMRLKDKLFITLSHIAEGNCAQTRGDLNSAISAYQKALTYDQYAAGALLPLASIALQQNNPSQAKQYLDTIHTYVGYSAESVALGVEAARALGDQQELENLQRVQRAKQKG